jgi:hypothetical protein
MVSSSIRRRLWCLRDDEVLKPTDGKYEVKGSVDRLRTGRVSVKH